MSTAGMDEESAVPDDEDADSPHDEQRAEPYAFALADVDEASRLLDAAFVAPLDGWEGWTAVETAIRDNQSGLGEPCLGALKQLAARGVDFVRDGGAGAEFVTDGVVLPAVSDVAADEVRLWEALAGKVTAPAARARLTDLLFVRRAGKPGIHARTAVRAYLDAISGHDDDLTTTVYLLRAWTLCRLVKAVDLEPVVLDEVERRVDVLDASGGGHSMPGVMYPLLRVLCEKPLDTARDIAVKAHADEVLARLAADVQRGDLATSIAAMRRKIAGPAVPGEVLEAIYSDELDGYMREADHAANAMVRLLRLESAARVATQRGLTRRVKEIAARMQAIRPDDLGMETVTSSTPVPKWMPELYLRGFTKGPTWREGIARFLLTPEAPSGRVADLRAFAEEGRGSLRRVFASAILGPDGLPRTTLTSEDEKDLQDMELASRTHAEWNGQLLAEGLHRIATKYGRPDVDELTLFLTDFGACDVAMARSLAKAFGYFWDGDYEAAACVVVPKVEAAARVLLRQLDEGIYQVQVGQSKGGYPGLYVLLSELEKLALDEDWAWFLLWLLAAPVGPNLRNEVAHGFRSDLGPTYTALVIRAAAVLITAAPETQGDERTVSLAPARHPMRGRLAGVTDRLLRRVAGFAMGIATLAEGSRLRLRGSGSE